jgi:hypothetical protein
MASAPRTVAAMNSPAAWAQCAGCAERFLFDQSFYAARDLTPPRLCRRCRGERKARMVTIAATVERVGAAFIFAKGSDGARYFIGPATLAADLGELRVGDAVVLDVDPLAPVEAGRKPRALRVRRP